MRRKGHRKRGKKRGAKGWGGRKRGKEGKERGGRVKREGRIE